MKRILNFLLTLIVISVFIVFINVLLGSRLDLSNYKIIFLFTLAYGSANYLGIHLFLYILDRIFTKEGQEKIKLILGIIFSILISVIATTLVNIVLLVGIEGKSIYDIWVKGYFFSYYLLPVFISVVVTLIYFISDFYKKTYQTKNKKQELVIQKISSQYEGLQQQLSPHFLFNSLNVLDSLIEENPKSAQEFTQELSQIYRYVLEQQSNDFTTIKEELEFVRNYANLMNKRFESSVEMIISENINTENNVFPLSIQLLIENAFKHNALNETHPLKIEIEQEGALLVIKNNLIPKKNIQTTSQKGLLNIEERYRKLGLMMSIKKTENLFIVKLPIINKNFITMEYTIDQREQAEKRVKELKEFYNTLASYIMAVLICTAVNLITLWDKIFTPQDINFRLLWIVWVIVPWGIVLLAKAIRLFWLPNSRHDWEEKKIQELLDKEKKV